MILRFSGVPLDAIAAFGTGPEEDDETEPVTRAGCVVYSAGTLHEAQLVLDLLDEAGIVARLFNQHLVGAMGELPLHESLPKIWLLSGSDFDAARAVIDAYEERRKQDTDEVRRCHGCGDESPANFELCWRCREPFE
jgi:hypothetical protein